MAISEIPVLRHGAEAASDLSALQYRAMKRSSGKWEVAGVADVATGILQNKPVAGADASVMSVGVTPAIASAAIAENAKVAPAANGKLRTAVTGDHVLGIAQEAAAGDGSIFSILLCPGGAPIA